MMERGVRITALEQLGYSSQPVPPTFRRTFTISKCGPERRRRRPSRQPMGLFSGAHPTDNEARSSVGYTISVGKTRPALVCCFGSQANLSPYYQLTIARHPHIGLIARYRPFKSKFITFAPETYVFVTPH